MAIALSPGPVVAQTTALEVVAQTSPCKVSLTRGEPSSLKIKVRNAGEAPLVMGTLQFEFAASESGEPPNMKRPDLIYPEGVTLQKNQVTTIGILFPAYNAVGDYRGELYVTGPQPGDPRVRFHTCETQVREPEGPRLSRWLSGWIALALTALVLFLPFAFVFKDGAPDGPTRNFFKTPRDPHRQGPAGYSVSRFQVWLWTAAILFSFTFIFFTRGPNVDIPDTLLGLMGLSAGSIVTATAIAVMKDGTSRQTEHPRVAQGKQNWLASMLSEGGEPSAMRLQMFAWTIAMVVFFVHRAITTATLWDIPPTLLAFMGVSHGGYLLDKTVSKR